MLIPNKQKTIIIIGAIILLIGVLAVFKAIYNGGNSKENLIEVPGFPQSEWTRKLDTGEVSGDKIRLTNPTDNYYIEIPRDWDTPEQASFSGGLRAFKDLGDEEYISLSVLAFDSQNDALLVFNIGKGAIGAELPVGEALKTIQKLEVDTSPDTSEVVPNSLVVEYLISIGDKTYILSCSTVSDSPEENIALCEDSLKTFRTISKADNKTTIPTDTNKVPAAPESPSGLYCPMHKASFTDNWTFAHAGIDIFGDYGAPVYAIEGGIVKDIGWGDDTCGWGISIENSDLSLMESRVHTYSYCHMIPGQTLGLSVGSSVAGGGHIGYNGKSGISTNNTPYIYLEEVDNDIKVNPYFTLKAMCSEN